MQKKKEGGVDKKQEISFALSDLLTLLLSCFSNWAKTLLPLVSSNVSKIELPNHLFVQTNQSDSLLQYSSFGLVSHCSQGGDVNGFFFG